ncbi:MAG: hypothetical protein E7510_01305 [Ruminococcus sp.]|nr:hypothetical protein [Ruminococcus sp.]
MTYERETITGTNREYKDRLFKFIFGNPENKEWTLSLYNAVNGSSYTNPDDIKLTTLENVVYMNMKNDVSFLIADTMSFYEQQSSFNPNMPMRFFVYAGMVYSRYIETSQEYRKYSSKQQKAPTPKCICFYNGTSEKDDKTILKLSDSFDSESDIEVIVTMINVNYGHNKELMEACKPLEEYAFFIDRVRMYQKDSDNLEEAIDKAVEDLPDNSMIKQFLMINKAEVKRMCITEYDEERTLNETREEGREEGRAEGREEGRAEGRAEGREEGTLKTLIKLVTKGILTLSQAAEEADMTVAEFEAKCGEIYS